MRYQAIQILWDCSHLWGLMAWRAMLALGAPCSLVCAEEIAQGSLMRNPPAILLVPGGNALQKEARLGRDGLAAIRQWLAAGGFYLGFCGGAGLALSNPGQESLAICPWRRQSFTDRFYHMISGYVIAKNAAGNFAAPVWWPGQFDPRPASDIEILASYLYPDKELWLADMPIGAIPAAIRAQWHQTGCLEEDLRLAPNLPLTITGRYGHGRYILSYTHLETPAAKAANAWLARLAQTYTTLEISRIRVPDWDTLTPRRHHGDSPIFKHIAAFHAQLGEIMLLARKLGFFFERTAWLHGWRPGMPGMVCNHLLACASACASLAPSDRLLDYWQKSGQAFQTKAAAFHTQAEKFFWTAKLKNALDANAASSIDEASFLQEKYAMFGHPMHGGGLAQELLQMLEDMIYLGQR